MSTATTPPGPRRPAHALLTPLALVLFIASLSALAASVLLILMETQQQLQSFVTRRMGGVPGISQQQTR